MDHREQNREVVTGMGSLCRELRTQRSGWAELSLDQAEPREPAAGKGLHCVWVTATGSLCVSGPRSGLPALVTTMSVPPGAGSASLTGECHLPLLGIKGSSEHPSCIYCFWYC